MKVFLISILFASAGMAFADVTVVDSKEHACGELQTMLNEQGVLSVKGPFGQDLHFAAPNCPQDYKANYSYVRSNDKNFCGLGYVCQLDMKGGE